MPTLVNAKKHYKFYKNEMPSIVNKKQTKQCLSVLLFETDQVRCLEVTHINSLSKRPFISTFSLKEDKVHFHVFLNIY
jgi:hypothetical protein